MSSLFGYNVFVNSRTDLISQLHQRIESKTPTSIVSLNTLKLYQGSKDTDLEKLFQAGDYIIPDGQSIVLAERLVHGNSIEAISGAELMVELIRQAEQKGHRLFFLGSPQELIDKVKSKIEVDFPGLTGLVDFQNGYYNIETDEEQIVQRISDFHPDILFVAFGSPRKEEFIVKNQGRLGTISMGVGGSYEYFVGDVKLDGVTKKLGIRWLVRMLQDPRRLARRYAVCNTYFLGALIKEIVKSK